MLCVAQPFKVRAFTPSHYVPSASYQEGKQEQGGRYDNGDDIVAVLQECFIQIFSRLRGDARRDKKQRAHKIYPLRQLLRGRSASAIERKKIMPNIIVAIYDT